MTEPLLSRSPADPSDELGRFPIADAEGVDRAVARARDAFPAWRNAGFDARRRVIERFRDAAAARADELAQLIAREMGKAIWDARGEARLLPAKVDVTLCEGMRYVAPIDAGPGARASFHPRGVLAVLGPFNFPAHLPNGHIVPALATGNTVVFKPSELTPAVGAFLAALWAEAGLPAGVLEVVQGAADTGRTLVAHPDVDAILFTGSWSVGRAIEEAVLDQPWKLTALEMGGKNAMIVLDDADLELAVAEAAVSACATTGQRCSCLSRIFAAPAILEPLVERLTPVLEGLRVGNPLDPETFMGPLVSPAAFERVARYRGLATEAGGERLLCVEPERGAPFVGAGLVRFPDAAQHHAYQRDEIFGPELAIYPIDDLDAAIEAVNDSEFGLAASVMTTSRAAFEACRGRVRSGILNWNRGTIGASGKLPFGGWGRSGNDRPAGILATVYCTTPQAHLESEAPFDPSTLPPGVPSP